MDHKRPNGSSNQESQMLTKYQILYKGDSSPDALSSIW